MKVLAHLSLLFLIGIFTYKTPVFAQETRSSTGITLQVFVPSAVLKNAIEEAASSIKISKKSFRLAGPLNSATVSSMVEPKRIKLDKEDGKLSIVIDLDGTASISIKNPQNSAKLITNKAVLRGKIKLLIGLKAQEDWNIDIEINDADMSVDFSKAITTLGSAKISVEFLMKSIVRQHIKNKTEKLKADNSQHLENYAKKISSTLDIFVKELIKDTSIQLLTVPESLFATTQPHISSTGIYLDFVARAETASKTGTTSVSARHSPRLPSTLRVLPTSTDGYFNLKMSSVIDFKTINKQIKKQLKGKPVEKEVGSYTFKLEEAVLAPVDHAASTKSGTVTMKILVSSEEDSGNSFDQSTRHMELHVEPMLSDNKRQISFKNVDLSGKSIELIKELANNYPLLTTELVVSLVQDGFNINLNGIFEEKLQEKISVTEKNIKITASVSPKTGATELTRVDRSSFLIKANIVPTTLKFQVTGFDNF